MTPGSSSPALLALTLDPRRVTRILGLTAAALVLASVAGQLFRLITGHDTARGVIPLFYVDSEANVPTFFSAAVLLIAALLLGAIAFVKSRTGGRHYVRWMLLAFTFLYFSIDEAVGFHELLNGPVRQMLGPSTRGIFFYAWVLPGAAAAALLGLAFLRLLWEFPERLRRLVVVGATLFVGGAIGVELIGGWYFGRYGDSFAYSVIATVEESAEMAGVILFIHALLGYLGETIGELRLTFGRG